MAGLLGSLFESAEAESVRPTPPITPPSGPPTPTHITPVEQLTPNPTKIVVVGLGGAGNNTLNRLSSIGTSGTVVPAAQLVLMARLRGATTVLFDLEPPDPRDPATDLSAAAYLHVIRGDASETVPLAVDRLLAELA